MKDEELELASALDHWATQMDMGRKPDPKSLIRKASAELRRLQAELDAIKQALAAPVQPIGYVKLIDTPFGEKLKPVLTVAVPVGSKLYTTPPAQPAPVPLTDEQTTDKDRIDWLNNNFFNRENVDWLTGNVSQESLMWVFFAPTKVQGDIRRVIDSAIERDGITKGQP